LYLTEGILRHGQNRIVCPSQMKRSVLEWHHDSAFAGHRGPETTINAIKPRFYWNFMPSEVRKYCQSCSLCQRFNYPTAHARAPLIPISCERPWQIVGLDFMGPLQQSSSGNAYIIVAIDHFTKYVEAAATVTCDALTTAQFLFNTIVCRYGMVESILTDQGANFESKLFKHLCELIGSKKIRTSTYHPEGNGKTERVNKTVKPCLAKFVNDAHSDWDLFLSMAIAAYNSSVHSTIGISPFEAMFGRTPVLVADVIAKNKLPSNTRLSDVSEFVVRLKRNASRIHESILRHSVEAQARQKKNYDKHVRDRSEFAVGDLVKIDNPRHRIGHSKCFEAKFLGPFRVVETIGERDGSSAGLRDELVHYNRLYKYCEREKEQNELAPSVENKLSSKALIEKHQTGISLSQFRSST